MLFKLEIYLGAGWFGHLRLRVLWWRPIVWLEALSRTGGSTWDVVLRASMRFVWVDLRFAKHVLGVLTLVMGLRLISIEMPVLPHWLISGEGFVLCWMFLLLFVALVFRCRVVWSLLGSGMLLLLLGLWVRLLLVPLTGLLGWDWLIWRFLLQVCIWILTNSCKL